MLEPPVLSLKQAFPVNVNGLKLIKKLQFILIYPSSRFRGRSWIEIMNELISEGTNSFLFMNRVCILCNELKKLKKIKINIFLINCMYWNELKINVKNYIPSISNLDENTRLKHFRVKIKIWQEKSELSSVLWIKILKLATIQIRNSISQPR